MCGKGFQVSSGVVTQKIGGLEFVTFWGLLVALHFLDKKKSPPFFVF